MKVLILFFAVAMAQASFANAADYVCSEFENKNQTALVAGRQFQLIVDQNFGMNANFDYPIRISSAYLGTCDGVGTENTHPMAEGYAGMTSVGGANCAADGFDVFMSAGIAPGNRPGLIQVDVGSDEVSYSCSKVRYK